MWGCLPVMERRQEIEYTDWEEEDCVWSTLVGGGTTSVTAPHAEQTPTQYYNNDILISALYPRPQFCYLFCNHSLQPLLNVIDPLQ